MTDLLGPPWLGPAVRRRGQFTCYSRRSNHVLATARKKRLDNPEEAGESRRHLLTIRTLRETRNGERLRAAPRDSRVVRVDDDRAGVSGSAGRALGGTACGNGRRAQCGGG